jgi:hypothetical protein
LSCRSGWYERAADEVYTHMSCEACNMEEAANGTDEKSGTVEALREAALRGKGIGRIATATARRAANITKMVIRFWAFEKALCLRRNSGRKEKRHLRVRVWMLGY